MSTPPLPVPSPDEKGGGLCVRLAPSPCKKNSSYRNQYQKTIRQWCEEWSNPGNRIMKDGGQTRSGADTPRAELLKPKNKIRVGSWNVRTLYQAGKLQQVLREMGNYKVERLCVSEARWIDSGKRTLSSGHTILYSGRSDNQHRGGVAIIVTRKVEKTLLEWKPINDRLLKARFNSKFAKLTVIAC